MDAQEFYLQGLDKAIAGIYMDAIRDFDLALLMNSNLLDIYYNRGLAHYKLGNWDAAIQDFNHVLEANLVNGFTRLNESFILLTHVYRGLVHHQLGNYLQALEDFQQAIILDLRFARAYYHRGLVYLELEMKQNALEDFQTASQLFAEQGNIKAYQNANNLIEILL
jgi:tetratricopeptide (TPR) repeat protein